MPYSPMPLNAIALAASLALAPSVALAQGPAAPATPAPSTAKEQAASDTKTVTTVAQANTAPATPGAAAAPAAAAEAANPNDGLKLDRIVITGTSQSRSKMRSSVSVSTIDGDSVVSKTANSSAELLRAVPGLRSESSGGESNANVGVRGIPISAGGARYIQFQEDGLPVLQFGDIAFATPDTWIRADVNLDRLEVVRGGSASTLATGAPGGIINYISKTGEEAGGSLALSKGLDYSHTKVEFGTGGRLAPKTRYYFGGHYRNGDGGRPGARGTEDGGQFKGNVTQELTNGFVRVSFKHLDDRSPTFLPTPVRFNGSRIDTIPGLDPRRDAFYSAGWPQDRTLRLDNSRETSNIRDGLQAKSDAIGSLIDLDIGNGFRLQNNFRWSKNSGRFVGIFPGDDVSAAPAGTTVATGANAGAAYTGQRFTAVVFNTRVDDAGLLANDFKVSKRFDLGDGNSITGLGGLYNSRQRLKLTWNFNQYQISANGENAQLLNVTGFINGSPGFGGCCSNSQDSTYRTTAPYIAANFDSNLVSADLSIRQDRNTALGSYYQTLPGFGGTTAGEVYNTAAPRVIDYNFNRTSFSAGANFRLNNDLSLFGRFSDGAAYNADRITFFNDAGLVNGRSSTIPQNEVRQFEGGVKWRAGGVSLFGTLFAAKTTEINVDLTSAVIAVNKNTYSSKGLELEAAYRTGAFGLTGGMTFTDAEVTKSGNAAIVGKTPKRQAKVVYQLSPTYSLGDTATFGASIVGTTSSKDDGPNGPVSITLPAFFTVNAFASVGVAKNLDLILSANNLLNKLGYTESNDGRGAARAVTGRTVKATLKYNF
jgi:catecholate siderophore receptor